MIHGGRLKTASRRFGIPASDWLDLSTGIAPWPWPVPALPAHVWSRLPEAGDGLLSAAAACYGCIPEQLTAVPGSQFAIGELPRAVRPGTVAVPAVGYAEHARCWRAADHRIAGYRDLSELESLASRVDHAVVINPNNPTGERCPAERLLALRRKLAGGLLIVDEAFMDTGDDSLVPHLPVSGVLVLRSLGKFFGLAGPRLGFVVGHGKAIERLRSRVEPWGVSHPARWVGRLALQDMDWQLHQRRRIIETCGELVALLACYFPRRRIVAADLFATVWFDDGETAAVCFEALAQQGVLVRLGDNRRWLRFGLPGDGMARLTRALKHPEAK